MHSGVGGLAHVLAEIRLGRRLDRRGADAWPTGSPTGSASVVPDQTDCTLLRRAGQHDRRRSPRSGPPGADDAVARLAELGRRRTAGRRPSAGRRGYLPGRPDQRRHPRHGRGAARRALGAAARRRRRRGRRGRTRPPCCWPRRSRCRPAPTGGFVPLRFAHPATGDAQMPNSSHGLAGIAAALAVAGVELDRPDLVDGRPQRRRAPGDARRHRRRRVRRPALPPAATSTTRTRSPTPGATAPTGTSLLFAALRPGRRRRGRRARRRSSWHRRCLHSVRTSGMPARLHPGFWDNDGRCCGTAGVGDVFLDAWQRDGRRRATSSSRCSWPTPSSSGPCATGPHAYWRFIEHRAAEPLLPPGVGWMQGAAGIAAYLFRVSRSCRTARTPTLSRGWTPGGRSPSRPPRGLAPSGHRTTAARP